MGVHKFPYPPVKPNIDAKVKISTHTSVTGAQVIDAEHEGKCIYNERHAWVQDTEGKRLESKGLVIFYHDICPECESLTGHIELLGSEKKVIVGRRLRNPDGSVHHVELELM